MTMAKCRGCGAEIIWIKLKSGKLIPCNPKPVYIENGSAKEVIITTDGRVSNGRQEYVKSNNPAIIRGYVSHFATCPMSGVFRKGRHEE